MYFGSPDGGRVVFLVPAVHVGSQGHALHILNERVHAVL